MHTLESMIWQPSLLVGVRSAASSSISSSPSAGLAQQGFTWIHGWRGCRRRDTSVQPFGLEFEGAAVHRLREGRLGVSIPLQIYRGFYPSRSTGPGM